MRTAALLLVTLLAMLFMGVSTAAADSRHGGRHHGYGDRYSYGWGLSLGYPSTYWGGYSPAYRYYPPYAYGYPYGYGPGYGVGYRTGLAGSIGFGYSSGHHDAYGLFLSLPLYFGPRHQPAYVAPAPVPASSTQRAVRQAPSGCLQTREYQTQIVIDGRAAPAYGTACLQADGSWKIVSGPFVGD
jgi:hypothetical protein